MQCFDYFINPALPSFIGPIYHELEPADIEAVLSVRNSSGPPIPPRERPIRSSPVYERIASVKRKLTLKLSTGSRVVTRVSLDGAYIIGEVHISFSSHCCTSCLTARIVF